MNGNVDPIGIEPTTSAGAGGDWIGALVSAAMNGNVDPIGIEPTTSAMPWQFGAYL
jgi:hypothetical protein